MNLKKLVLSALLLAIGLLLHQITPAIFMGMKPDFLLSMMFIVIVLNDDYKLVLTVGITAGILTAITTTFPGGQVANLIDKFITCNLIFLLCKLTKSKLNSQLNMLIVSSLGTLISGFIFLGSAFLLFGLPAAFSVLFFSVVLPAALINTFATAILYNSIKIALRHTSY